MGGFVRPSDGRSHLLPPECKKAGAGTLAFAKEVLFINCILLRFWVLEAP
jgi:hypothetical protein